MFEAWLVEKGLSAKGYEGAALLEAFRQEMRLGLRGAESSLAMLPTYLAPVRGAVEGTVAFVDAGGTNLRTGLAVLDGSGAVRFEAVKKQPMPGRNGVVSAAAFYAAVCEGLLPLADRFERIGFCFSYPAEILPDGDGRLLGWTKEVEIPEMVGSCVGAGLRAALRAAGAGEKSVVVLNDTTATLLAGCSVGHSFGADQFVGFILGTGTNAACVHEGAVVNMESGNFGAWKPSVADDRLDEQSVNRGVYRFEKAVAGAYLGSLTLEALRLAATEGWLSDEGRAWVLKQESLETVALSMRLGGATVEALELQGEDERLMLMLFERLVERAALFSAVNMVAGLLADEGVSAAPACICADGSTFYRTPGLAAQTEVFMRELLAPFGREFRVVTVEDAPAVGSAMAAVAGV